MNNIDIYTSGRGIRTNASTVNRLPKRGVKPRGYLALLLMLLFVAGASAEAISERTDDGYAVTFTLDTARWEDQPDRVSVAGEFNGWNAGADPMENVGGTVWSATLPLDAGEYQYKFVIDGDRWITDPTDDPDLRADDTFGGQNSGVIVGPDVRKAPPPEPNAINAEFVRHDPATDVTAIDDQTLRVTVRALAGDVERANYFYNVSDDAGDFVAAAARSGGVAADRTADGYDVFELTLEASAVREPVPESGTIEYVITLKDGEAAAFIGSSDGRVVVRPLTGEWAVESESGESLNVKTADETLGDVGLSVPFGTFDVPEWAHHAVWYQIFPERFRNADESNDPGRYGDYENLVDWNTDWWAVLPGETAPDDEYDNFYTGTGDVWRRRYGGDLQGVREKLPYLRELGVNAIYFNPIFEAESMHKYDTSDFRHVDDNFGVRDDGEEYPPAFEGETADPATWVWSPSDKVFLDFLEEAHAQGFKVIIDGVFNHTGRAHPFFQDVLQNGRDSEYADWFEITDWGTGGEPGTEGGIQWAAWDQPNGHLPVFKKDDELGLAEGPRQHIFDITKRWTDPDGDPSTRDGVDGWRLDVPGDIPHPFWKDWREVVKAANPDAYITGEIWSFAEPWLQGDEFDATMNYPFATAAQDFFVDDATAIPPSEFADRLEELTNRYARPITLAMQNLMASHDTDRLASMFVNPDRPYDGANRPQDNAASFDGPAYDPREPTPEERAKMRQLVLFQHAFVGAPMTYYGDEAGMWSPDDPSNRQPLPWPDRGPYAGSGDGFDADVFADFQRAMAIRNSVPALRTGAFETVLADDATGVYAFERRGEEGGLTYVVLAGDEAATVEVPAEAGRYVDFADPEQARVVTPDMMDARPRVTPVGEGVESDGSLTVELPAHGVAVLVRQ